MRKRRKSSFLKKICWSIAILLIGFAGFNVIDYYNRIFQPNVILFQPKSETDVFIPTGADFNYVVEILYRSGTLLNTSSFRWVAEKMNYVHNIRSGRYIVRNGMNNRELVNMLRVGNQVPLKVVLHGCRSKEDLAGKIANYLEPDSADIIREFDKLELPSEYGVNEGNKLSIIIPNTYEIYWNTAADNFFKRMLDEYKIFWNHARQNKAAELHLSPAEVTILASIVQKETTMNDEKNRIAGVYINRLRKGMLLQADPTIVYAAGDFTINRVLNEHKKIDSPYNTYKFKGLPPGPICIPEINTIDAVLNFEQHDFLFFCAKEDFSGYHNFAVTYKQHRMNARRFQQELNKQRIFR